MAEEAGSEIVTCMLDHLNKVKTALLSRSNMDKTLKEEALQSVSELNISMNKISGMFLSLELSLHKAITTAERGNPRLYSELVAPSPGNQNNFQPTPWPRLPPGGRQYEAASLIIKPAEANTPPEQVKKLLRETVDPRALKIGINKMKNISNNALLVECSNSGDRDELQKELNKLDNITVELPKKKLPTLLLKFVPNNIADSEIKDIIIQQNNLAHIAEPVLNIRFTKAKLVDSRHLVVEVSPSLRRELLAPSGIKLNWNICRAEDFVAVTRCFKCLGFGHTSKFCTNGQKCSNCAGEHLRQNCDNPSAICCSNCIKANTLIHNNNKKLNVNHSAFSNECTRLQRIKAIIISKTEF